MEKITEERKVEFAGFEIWEDGESRKLSLDELIEFEKQGYKMEVRLVKPEVVKIISIVFKKEK